MKLSMWMILNRLEEFNVHSYIESDEKPMLKSARMAYAPQCIQVSQAGDDVICRGGEKDYFLIEDMECKQGFEIIQGIFDYYDDWDDSLQQTACMGDYQAIVDSCYPIFHNPLVLMDANNQLIAMSSQYGSDELDGEWKFVKENGFSSVESVSYLKVLGQNFDNAIHNIPQIFAPRSDKIRYNIANRKVFWQDELCARFVLIEKDRSINSGDLQLLQHIGDIIAPRLGQFRQENGCEVFRDALAELMQNGRADSDKIERHMTYNRWNREGAFRVYVIEPLEKLCSENTLHLFRRSVLKLLPFASVNILNNTLVVIVQEEAGMREHLMDVLDKLWMAGKVHIGASLLFYNIYLLPLFYRQAEYAMNYQKEHAAAETPYFFGSCALEFLIRSNDPQELYYACHPEVLRLHRQDREKDTEYVKILKSYLDNERNSSDTARDLFMHRNTLIYRLKKLMECVSDDLNSPYTRDYMKFSIYIISILKDEILY